MCQQKEALEWRLDFWIACMHKQNYQDNTLKAEIVNTFSDRGINLLDKSSGSAQLWRFSCT